MFNINLFFRDVQGNHDWYEAIAVIEYDGRLLSMGESAGHYTCDIKERISSTWFKTNDDQDPIPIHVSDVSQYGYVVLLKRKI